MKIGNIDLQPLTYLLVYKDLRDGTINTWTLEERALKVNYPQMKKDVEFLGIYKKLSDTELLDIMTR